MISLLRKKRQTTRPNIRLATNLRLGRFALSAAALLLLLLGQQGFPTQGFAAQGSTTLKWGRPHVTSRKTNEQVAIRPARQQPRSRVFRDSHVVVAGWEDNSAPAIQPIAAEVDIQDRSVVVERAAPAYDPFDEDDRLAQLPVDPADDDPFDEPIGESPFHEANGVPEPEDSVEEDLDTIEEAVEAEIQRRQSAEEMFDEPMANPLEDHPLDELDQPDPMHDAPDEEELLQPEKNDFDLNLDFDRDRNPEEDFQEEEPADEEGLTAEELEEQRKELEKERRESEENCREELKEIASNRISSIDLSIRVEGNAGEDFPHECAVSTQSHQPRQWPQVTYNWTASALCHKPLYFEQVQLERYGHSWGPYMQPLMSGVHFFGTIPVLPYKMGIRTPNECVYTLGYYRPGSCAPYMIDPIPFTWRAVLFEGAAATGISFLTP